MNTFNLENLPSHGPGVKSVPRLRLPKPFDGLLGFFFFDDFLEVVLRGDSACSTIASDLALLFFSVIPRSEIEFRPIIFGFEMNEV